MTAPVAPPIKKKELKLRSMFVAPPGHVLISFDLKQAELWVVAYLSDEKTLKHELLHGNPHGLTASEIFKVPKTEIVKGKGGLYKKEYYVGKQSNHMLNYRASARRLVQAINKESDGLVTISNKQGTSIYGVWSGLYISIPSWWNEIECELSTNNRTLVTPYGRIRVFFEAWGLELFKQATAHVPQSTVGDHLNGAVQTELGIEGGLVKVHEDYVKNGAVRIVQQGHDSLVTEVPIGVEKEVAGGIKSRLERPLIIRNEQFTIPVEVEMGERWGELEEMKI